MRDQPRRFPDRAALEDVLRRATSPQAAAYEALGERRLWWKTCAEAVRADPSWLLGEQCEELRTWLNATLPDQAAESLPPADHGWLLGRVVSDPDDGGEAFARLAEAWSRSRLVSADAAFGPPDAALEALPPNVAARLQDLYDEETGVGSLLLIAASLLMGVAPAERPAVSMPVVFGRIEAATAEGTTGVLELRELPSGPAGLYPDPRTMAGAYSTNGQFAAALGRAWLTAGPRRTGRCVLWRLVLADRTGPVRVEGPSLGAAFALCLREVVRRPPTRRPAIAWLRGVLYGLRPRTAVTGALGGDERLLKVSGMGAKLLAAHRKGLRLIAPEANRLDLPEAPNPGEVRFAATLKQADRYARRFRTGRLAIALTLVAAVIVTRVVVSYQDAAAKDRLVTAHRLAGVSQNLLSADAGLAELFAVQAYRYTADPLTRAALFQSVTSNPYLVGGVAADGPISAVAASADGHVALAGTRQGEVQQWRITGNTAGPAHTLGRLRGSVSAVAADAGGDIVAALGRDTVQVWASGRPAPAPRTPAGQRPTAVAVSPSGRYAAVTTTTGKFEDPPTMWVLDRTTGNTRRLELDLQLDATAIGFPSDSAVVTAESGYGGWERFSLPRPVRTAGSTVGFGTHNYGFAFAPDGSAFTYTNGAAELPVWKPTGKPEIDGPPLTARTGGGSPSAMALSPGGAWAAEAVGSSIHLARATAPDEPPGTSTTVSGAGAVPTGGLAFLGGDGRRLISASGTMLNLWDVRQYSRISTVTTALIAFGCNACDEPDVAFAPDGHSIAIVSGSGTTLDVRGLDPRGVSRHSLRTRSDEAEYATALWQGKNKIIVPSQGDGAAQILSATGQGLARIGTWPSIGVRDKLVRLRSLPGGRQVAALDTTGAIRFLDAATGKVLRQVDGPADMAHDALDLHKDEAALDARAEHAAVVDTNGMDDVYDPSKSRIVVTDTTSGHERSIPGEALGLAYAGDRLLVQRRNGDLEAWTASGDRRLGTLDGAREMSVGPVVGPDLIAEKRADNAVVLIDIRSGLALGTITIPAGVRDGGVDNSTGLAFSADGGTLVTATEAGQDPDSDLGTLIDWKLEPSAWIRAACASAGRDLTPAVWRQYAGTRAPSDLRCAR